MKPPRLYHEHRILLLALLAGLPGVLATLGLLYGESHSSKVRWTLIVCVGASWLGFAFSVRDRVVSPLRTLANLLEAMREGDYSIRARDARGQDALGEVMQQVNAMGATLRAQRLGAMEATTLLRKVMEEIDVAIFAFDEQHKLKLVNRAGERLLGQPAERILDSSAESLELAGSLEDESEQTTTRTFRGASGRWGIHRSAFREGGRPHQLLVVTDLTRALREEELLAWQRIVRVLGHELNNSLTPIKSIAGSLSRLLSRQPRPEDWEDDMKRGLEIVETRSESLSRFMGSYARLARLPRPKLEPMAVTPWIRRVVGLETRLRAEVIEGPELMMRGDLDQLEQLLINLLRNAVDATLDASAGQAGPGAVSVSWLRAGMTLEVWVRDEGPGLANTGNLFVPFFTTKPGGSGIGLALSRQIAEGHGGTLTLENRKDRRGCEARLVLPL